MALQLGALRAALLNPGDPALADKAAEEVAGYENRLASIETKLGVLMAGVSLLTALMIGNLWLTVNVLSRLPR